MDGTNALPSALGLGGNRHNFVFLGEAGSGKSEIAINFAKALARTETRPVHFFDLDMTKPLFRSRDAGRELEQAGITGARSIGGFAPQLNRPSTAVVYVINAYRPWSDTIEHIDETLGRILGVSHVKLTQLFLAANPSNGLTTTLDEVVEGFRKTDSLVGEYLPLSFACVREELAGEAARLLPVPVFPLRLALTYPWLSQGAD